MSGSARWLAVHSFKGGTGKSTVAANLAVALAVVGKNVAVMDMDLAGPGIHVMFGVQESDVKHTLNDVLIEEADVQDAVVSLSERLGIKKGKLFFVPASYRVDDILEVLRSGLEMDVFSNALESVTKTLGLDYVLVDTHPGIENDTIMAIGVCQGLIVLSRLDQQDMAGTAILAQLAKSMGKTSFLIFNMVPSNIDSKSVKNIADKLANKFGLRPLASLPFNQGVLESLSKGVFILEHPDHEYARRFHDMADSLVRASF